MNILLVDDEMPAIRRMADLVDEIGGHAVVGQATNGVDALRKAERLAPDVVLMDIEMPGMNGLEAARHLRSLEPTPVVIFCTAFDDHALEAFEAAAVDYLLKPVRVDRLRDALGRAHNRRHSEQDTPLPEDTDARTHICANVRGNLTLVPVEDIICLVAEDKYVVVVHSGGEVLIEESLTSLEEEFGDRFLRLHRGSLASTNYISGLDKSGQGGHLVRLRGTDRVLDVSRRNLPQVRQAIKAL